MFCFKNDKKFPSFLIIFKDFAFSVLPFSEKSHPTVFIANFEHISHCSGVSILNFEQANGGWTHAYNFSRHEKPTICHGSSIKPTIILG